MPPRRKASKGSTETGGSAIGGDLTIKNGEMVGRDSIGLNGDEVSKIIEVLMKYFPKTYITNPEQLDKVFNEFQACHAGLYEWKELHNHLDTSLQLFDQFEDALRQANRRNANIESLYGSWFKIQEVLDELLSWAQTIQVIDQKFAINAAGEMTGPDWAIKLASKGKEINDHLQNVRKAAQESSGKGFVQRLWNPDPMDENWFRQLSEYASNYRYLVLRFMSIADKNLREMATKLYEISAQNLRR